MTVRGLDWGGKGCQRPCSHLGRRRWRRNQDGWSESAGEKRNSRERECRSTWDVSCPLPGCGARVRGGAVQKTCSCTNRNKKPRWYLWRWRQEGFDVDVGVVHLQVMVPESPGHSNGCHHTGLGVQAESRQKHCRQQGTPARRGAGATGCGRQSRSHPHCPWPLSSVRSCFRGRARQGYWHIWGGAFLPITCIWMGCCRLFEDTGGDLSNKLNTIYPWCLQLLKSIQTESNRIRHPSIPHRSICPPIHPSIHPSIHYPPQPIHLLYTHSSSIYWIPAMSLVLW